jgi:uncharacterized protein (TIGR02217 family)
MHLRAYIDACQAYGWSGSQDFNTRVTTLANGRERRNANASQGRHRYTVPFQNISREEYRSIRQMHEVCLGMLHAFLYFDPLANEADAQLFAVGDGATTQFQLSTLSVIDGVSYQRQVTALYRPGDNGEAVPSTVTVTVNGAPTVVTLNEDRGLVIFAAAPALGANLRWSGLFSVWVRFDSDTLPFSIDNRRGEGYAHNGTVTLIEVPPPEEIET